MPDTARPWDVPVLGITVAHDGQPNPIASNMFRIALGSAGGALILFFIALLQFFTANSVNAF